jgi:uncharacterized protein with ParB-like and HNH nuclease domain
LRIYYFKLTRGKVNLLYHKYLDVILKIKIESKIIKNLLVYKKHNALKVNSEYQRGAVWELDQQKRLIDSVLRGYPLPMIYLHDNTVTFEEGTFPSFEIIDGQTTNKCIIFFFRGCI